MTDNTTIIERFQAECESLLAQERALRPELRSLDAEISQLSSQAATIRQRVNAIETKRLVLERELHRMTGRIQRVSDEPRQRPSRKAAPKDPVAAAAKLLAGMTEEQIKIALNGGAP